jgi:hypothetical protein
LGRPEKHGKDFVKLAVTLELYAYWSRLRGARSAPERNDVDPGSIRSVLADTFLLDFDEESGFPFRIAGSRANALFLSELRSRSFIELWREEDRTEVCSILHCVADEAQPFLLGARGSPRGIGLLDIEVLLLPLRHHGLTHVRVLGGFAVGAAPDWIGLIGVGPLELSSLRALNPLADSLGAPAEGAPPAFSARSAPRRYKHLFVYSDDDRRS